MVAAPRPAVRLLPAALLFLGALLLAAPPVRAQEEDLEAQRQRLEELQRQIQEKRAAAARLGTREQSVLGELREVERELGVTRRLIETLGEELASHSDQIEAVTRDLARAQDQLAVKRQVLARRLRSIYKLGRYGAFEILLMADSFAEIFGRYTYLQRIAEQDGRLLEDIATLEARIRLNRAALEAARTGVIETREDRLTQADELTAAERDRARMLARVKSQRSEQLKAAAALEAETKKIQSVLATLERRRAEREAAARRQAADAGRAAPAATTSTLTGEFGALDWPVDGEILERFGRARHPVYNTEVINNGVDIRAPRGTPVRAVEAGEVAYADWNGGYGLMVILDHDGGYYSLYAHLDRASVDVGEAVTRRQAVGTVGESGSLVGPKLHFEIRQGGKAVDPVGWLKAR